MGSPLPDRNVLPPSLVEAWRADTSTPAELRRGYTRFSRHRPRARSRLRLAGWVLGGLVLGVSLAQAATLLPSHFFGAREAAVAPRPRAAKLVPERAAAPREPRAPVVPIPSASSAKPDNGTLATRSPQAALPRPDVAELADADLPADADVAAGAFRQPYVQRQWQRAAEAMRAGNLLEAEAAFVEIEQRASGGERDAACLARAQLLAKSGRATEALAIARELHARTQSRIVASKARELAVRLTKNDDADRSSEPDAAAKGP